MDTYQVNQTVVRRTATCSRDCHVDLKGGRIYIHLIHRKETHYLITRSYRLKWVTKLPPLPPHRRFERDRWAILPIKGEEIDMGYELRVVLVKQRPPYQRTPRKSWKKIRLPGGPLILDGRNLQDIKNNIPPFLDSISTTLDLHPWIKNLLSTQIKVLLGSGI